MRAPSIAPEVAPARAASTLLAALAAVYVIWGSTYLAMRVVVESMPPLGMGAARFTVAGAILLVVALASGTPRPRARHWLAAIPVGALMFVGGNGLVAIAETEVSSGVAALVCATMPLWMALFTAASGERPSGREWLGIAVGVAGVGVLVGGAELSATPRAALILVGSPLAWALGSVLARRLPTAPGLGGPGTQMLAGGLALFVAAAIRGESVPAHPSARSLAALLYLLVLGSLVGFTAYSWLLRNARPALASSYAFVNPVLAVLLGVLFGGEALARPTLIAAPLVVAAVVLVISGRGRAAKA
ncbi:MAG: drug/metabolite exporter YedA [Myxococcales bacterium]|nr:drug/metabolite exporter YedA [Myxococcales bacterium]